MKKSIVYLGIALLAFGNVAIANNENPVKITVTKNTSVTPFCQAVAKGDIETVKKMLEFGSNINERSDNGMTPLMFAARYNKVEIVKLLLENGAKAGLKDDRGFTALKHAELSNAIETVEILKEHKKK